MKKLITMYVTEEQISTCKKNNIKYSFVFTQGLLAVQNNPQMQSRIRELEEANNTIIKKLNNMATKYYELQSRLKEREISDLRENLKEVIVETFDVSRGETHEKKE